MSKQLLIDAMPIKLALQESEGGKMIARGEFARCDVPTQNGRTYPRGVYEREVKKLQESVTSRRAFGELDHPDDGKTKLARVSHVITRLDIDKNGVVMGEAEILDTPNGRTLKAILDSGAEVGVSSRGFGSTKQMPDGSSMVGEDFMLRSFDFVADPAMKTAYPQIFAEDVEVEFGNPSIEAEFPELAEDIRAKERAAAKIDAEAAVAAMIAANDDKVRSAMQEQFEKRLAESLSGIRESVAEGLREEFAADPAVGGSKAALAKIAEIAGVFAQQGDEVALRDAIRERDLKIGAMKESLDKAVDLARRTTYALVVEQRIGGHPMGERIRKMLGDIASFDSREALQARLEDVATEYDTILTERQQRTQDVHEAEIGELRERIAELEGEVEELEAEIEASTESAETSEDRLRESLEGIARKHTSEIDDLRSQLREAVDTANGYRNLLEQEQDKTQSAQVDAYKARRVSGHTNSSKLLSLLEGVQNENAIDAIVSENGTKNIGASDLQGLRESLKRGRSNPAAMMEEVTAAPSVFRDPMLGGMSANQILELSGIKRVR
jgi:hypothetical protein